MDIEFHYYMTYLIAAKAGFSNQDAGVIAHSSQYVDDNCMIFEVSKDSSEFYKNYISQTMNILKAKPKLFRIYPLFHFIPGDPTESTAFRKDGNLHWLNTTPNSKNANAIMDAALDSGSFYRIGIASHSFVDTWAHQNFIGYFDEFNSMAGVLEAASPNIGHADAGHNPDWPGLVWKDGRLLGDLSRVDNRARFLDAAKYLFGKYRLFVDPKCKTPQMEKDAEELLADLDDAIGYRDQTNGYKQARIAKYSELSTTKKYGDKELPEYDEHSWLEEAVNESVRGLRDTSDNKLLRWDPLTDVYTWKDYDSYVESNWYKFQEAVKEHQDQSWDIMKDDTFGKMDLKEL